MDEDGERFKLALAELKAAREQLNMLKGVKKEPPYCSFCGKGKNEYLHLIEGRKASRICDECIIDCMYLLQDLIDE